MTLTQAAKITRISLIGLVLAGVLGTIGGFGYNIWHQRYLASLPPVEEKPQNLFGELPALKLPKGKVSSANFSYSVDTTTGNFPDIPKLVNVYFIPPGTITLLSNQKARDLANKLGFDSDPQVISETKQRFGNQSGGSIEVDITTLNFSLSTSTPSAEASQSAAADATPEALINSFKNYLTEKKLLSENITKGPTKVNFDEINIWPEAIDSIPFITANPNRSLIRGVAKQNSASDFAFSNVSYTNWVVDTTKSSTYKIKAATQAFDELKAGDGLILLETSKSQVSLSNLYLAYYISEEYSPYLQPVYVFEGPNFLALVDAIQR